MEDCEGCQSFYNEGFILDKYLKDLSTERQNEITEQLANVGDIVYNKKLDFNIIFDKEIRYKFTTQEKKNKSKKDNKT